MIDSRKRTVTKALSWKLLGVIILSSLTYAVTGSIKDMTYVALLYHVIMMILFILHERTWNNFPWGRTSGLFIQMTGMSGAGKSTLANLVAKRLRKKGIQTEVIDGDEYRKYLCSDLGFSKEDRNENIRRLGFVSKVLARNNVVSIIAAINPYDSIRKELDSLSKNVKTVYIKCNINELKLRDTKDLYRRALLPDGHLDKVHNFTGISDPFDVPQNPNLIIHTDLEPINKSAKKLEDFIIKCIS